MFKEGDRIICITNKNSQLTQNEYYITHSFRYGFVVFIKNDIGTIGGYNSNMFKLDDAYYRKQKLKQIELCSK